MFWRRNPGSRSRQLVVRSATEEHELLATNGSVLLETAREVTDTDGEGNTVTSAVCSKTMDGKTIETKDGRILQTDMTEEEIENFENQWKDLWKPSLD